MSGLISAGDRVVTGVAVAPLKCGRAFSLAHTAALIIQAFK
jgi:hypothetical protein